MWDVLSVNVLLEQDSVKAGKQKNRESGFTKVNLLVKEEGTQKINQQK